MGMGMFFAPQGHMIFQCFFQTPRSSHDWNSPRYLRHAFNIGVLSWDDGRRYEGRTNQSINQSINQSTNQSINRSTNQSMNQASKQASKQVSKQVSKQARAWPFLALFDLIVYFAWILDDLSGSGN